MYLQEEPSTPPIEEPSENSEEPTNPDESTHLTMVHKSLSYGTEDASDICWKPSSPLSNVHFRNTTKIAVQVLCS